MSGVVVIGEPARVRTYVMTGATVIAAEDPAGVVAAWRDLPVGTGLVILTAEAARALSDMDLATDWPLVAVAEP